MELRKRLEKVGKVLTSGWGDRVAIGILIGALDKTTPHRCYEHIKDDISVLSWVPDDKWGKYSSAARRINFDSIDIDRVVSELRKYRPDLLGVIINHPDGLKWLQAQIDTMKEKLRCTHSSV